MRQVILEIPNFDARAILRQVYVVDNGRRSRMENDFNRQSNLVFTIIYISIFDLKASALT